MKQKLSAVSPQPSAARLQLKMESLCSWWQRQIRLSDWTIKICIVRHWELPNKQGTCAFQLSKRTALVCLLKPADHNAEWQVDLEQTLVHELLHIHMGTFSNTADGSAELTAEEQAVDALAHSLVELKRGTPR